MRRALFWLRDRTGAIRSPRFWRVVYGVLASRPAVAATAVAARAAARRLDVPPRRLVELGSHLFLTGWPHHRGTPWVNLNVLRFAAEVDRRLAGGGSIPQRPRRDTDRLRVGLLANLASTLTFSPPFFEGAPDTVDLHVFDIGGPDRSPGYLERHVEHYTAFDAGESDEIAAAVEAADLDVLLLDVYKGDLDRTLDGISVPCVVDVGTTVKLRFHPKVSFHFYCLQQADYLVRGDRLFAATSESALSDRLVVPGALLFDARDLDRARRRPWREREPLLVFHNKLYKASDEYLETVLGLLAEDSELTLVVFGRDDVDALERIRAAALRLGVAARWSYEGEFSPVRGADGRIADPGWLRVADVLLRARLVPDPWPLGGASSRVEAYAAGAPVVHMGIRTDPGSWRRPQPAVTADHPRLAVAEATATTVEHYREIARRLLSDESFADGVAERQADLARSLTDGPRFWGELLDAYALWRAEASAVRSRSRGRSR